MHLLCGTTKETMATTEKISFLQAVRAHLIKSEAGRGDDVDVKHELQQLISESVMKEGVMDVFKISDLKNAGISIMSDQLLTEIAEIP